MARLTRAGLHLLVLLQIPLSAPLQLQAQHPATLGHPFSPAILITAPYLGTGLSPLQHVAFAPPPTRLHQNGLRSSKCVASADDRSGRSNRPENDQTSKVLGSTRLGSLKTMLKEPKRWEVEAGEDGKDVRLLGSTTLRKAKKILKGETRLVESGTQRTESQATRQGRPASMHQRHQGATSTGSEVGAGSSKQESREPALVSELAVANLKTVLSDPVQRQWMGEILRVLAEQSDDSVQQRSAAAASSSQQERAKGAMPLAAEHTSSTASTEASSAPARDDAAVSQEQQEGGSTDAPTGQLRSLVAQHPQLRDFSLGTQARFLTLYQGSAEKALAGLVDYHNWLESPNYGVERVRDISEKSAENEVLSQQLATHKCYLVDQHDKEGRPVVVVHVDRHDPAVSPLDATTVLVVYTLFAAEARLREEATGTFSIVFDLSKARYKSIDLPLIQRFVTILTTFYPERLGVMLLHDAPGFFPTLCWPLIKPWLNPVTRSKVHFVSSSAPPSSEASLDFWLGRECLPTHLGGQDDSDY